MAPNSNHLSGDSESLQADVMRFMAIIAFCLIAIMALVRNVVPPGPVAPQAAARPQATRPANPQPRLERAQPLAMEQQAAPQPPLAEPAPVATPTKPADPAPVTAPPDLAAAAAAVTEPAQTGLSLRFASDHDFLRLVTKGDIEVFAFRSGDVLSLGRSFKFQSSQAPGPIYELMPDTIPALIGNALGKERPDTAAYAWGIRMPKRLERQIQDYLNSGAVGQLVINRYGEVRHEANT